MDNGVKQGGVLSPILFCVYLDELLKRLERTGVGCFIGHHFFGSVGYADDVKLLSPSITGLQTLVNTCEQFSQEYDVTFNTKKTLCICYGTEDVAGMRMVTLNGAFIPWQTEVKHLGNFLRYDLTDKADVRKKKGDFVAAVNKLNSVFSTVQAEIKLSLLQTYCTSWFGCQAWQLGTPFANEMNIQWQKAVRRTAGLPRQTRSVLLPGLSGNANFHVQHERRFARLYSTMLTSSNPSISFLATRASTNSVGVIGRNRVFLALKYGTVNGRFLVTPRSDSSPDVAPRVEQLRELLRARDGLVTIGNLEPDDISIAIEFLATYRT